MRQGEDVPAPVAVDLSVHAGTPLEPVTAPSHQASDDCEDGD